MTTDITRYYSTIFSEDDRLYTKCGGTVEWIRSIDILHRFLPPIPSMILDIGGGTGVYSYWLLEQGYKVNLVELVPLHVTLAQQKFAENFDSSKWSATVGDARDLDFPDSSVDAVLLMGPLYHIQKSSKRLKAISEALRVLKPGGLIFCAIISKFASFLDGLDSGFIYDSDFRKIVSGDLENSCHNNLTDKKEYFTTSYFQHPDELSNEMKVTGFIDIRLIGVEGILWACRDLNKLRKDTNAWQASLDFMRGIESDRSIIGTSPHIMGIGRKKDF